MDGGLTVTLISVAMFIGCFFLGFIPLLFPLNERSLQYISILGAGLLCGTALSITIPEGVSLLDEAWRGPSSSDVPPGLNLTEKNRTSSEADAAPRFFIGLALTLGFVFMFAVDQLCSYISMRDRATRVSSGAGLTVTLGLVIHAAADGFALGAAVATGQVTVQVVVFFAVILHKAPAAFGLVSFLMHSGLEKRNIQGHLLAFSAASPVVAIATYFILLASGGPARKQLSATGVGMLFSAGTFLYVATVHVLPESSSHREVQHGEVHPPRHLGLLKSLTLVLGVGLPTVLALGLQDD